MSKKVMEIYEEYKIMPNLQEHQLRVAAVAFFICDSLDMPLPKDEIILACLLHDMGNIIKSDLAYFPDFLEPEGLQYWEDVQESFFKKYGRDEHVATDDIVREIGVSQKVLNFINRVGFSNSAQNELEEFFEYKICNYADMRVGPYGVLSLEDRLSEGNKRYKGRPHTVASEKFGSLFNSIKIVESQIFTHANTKPEDITDEVIAPIMTNLRNFVIK